MFGDRSLSCIIDDKMSEFRYRAQRLCTSWTLGSTLDNHGITDAEDLDTFTSSAILAIIVAQYTKAPTSKPAGAGAITFERTFTTSTVIDTSRACLA